MEGKSKLPFLPQEIIFEILLRLPVKSVLKFRCVSKSWLFLLSNAKFRKSHVAYSLKNPKMSNYRLAAVASFSGLDTICNFYNIGYENACVICPPICLPVSGRILGSCNGLICLTGDSFTLMICNPCTRKFNVFPDTAVGRDIGGGGNDCYVNYGFGHDGHVEDYKVVKIFSFNQIEGRYENMVKVYSLKTKSWKIVQGFNSGYINAKMGIFANGVLHWEAYYLDDSWEIVTYDLALEKIGKMDMPNYGNEGIYWALGVSIGYLIGCCNCEPSRADVWVMKEYGVEKFWTKLVTISSSDGYWAQISSLFVGENGDEVLLKIDSEIKLYNSKDGSFKRLNGIQSGEFCQVQTATYVESLASPHI